MQMVRVPVLAGPFGIVESLRIPGGVPCSMHPASVIIATRDVCFGEGRMDFSQIESVLGLVSTAMGATGKAVSTVEAVKNLFAPGKTPDSGEASKLLNALAAELTAVNMMNVQLSETLKVISRELKQQDEFEKELTRYALYETPQGDIVYKVREEMAAAEPIHFICPACLKRDKLFIFISGKGDYKTCQVNTSHLYKFGNNGWPKTRPRSVV